MTHKAKKNTLTKDVKYSKKFSAGKIIGLQNVIPGFALQDEVVFFTDNFTVAELHEIDVDELRKVIDVDSSILQTLW